MNENSIIIKFLSRKIFSTFSEQIIMIDSKTVAHVNINYAEAKEFDKFGQPTKWRLFIQIIYKNGAVDELPITDDNLKIANELLNELSKPEDTKSQNIVNKTTNN